MLSGDFSTAFSKLGLAIILGMCQYESPGNCVKVHELFLFEDIPDIRKFLNF